MLTLLELFQILRLCFHVDPGDNKKH